MTKNILNALDSVPPAATVQPSLTGEQATYKVNGYLTKYVGMYFRAVEPVFLPLERPVWQVLVHFQMYDVGPFPIVFLDVDALTGDVLPLTDDQIDTILDRADALVSAHTPTTAPPF